MEAVVINKIALCMISIQMTYRKIKKAKEA
jgi:hypothetical protein